MSRALLCILVSLLPCTLFAATQSYTTPGTYTFTVPSYSTLTVEVWGAGGGGGAALDEMCGGGVSRGPGFAGGSSLFGSVSASGGGGGGAYNCIVTVPGGSAGTAGTGLTGTLNVIGMAGYWGGDWLDSYSSSTVGKGGTGANGGSGGVGGVSNFSSVASFPVAGTAPGGGGGGASAPLLMVGGGGGGGGYARRTYAAGDLSPGSTIAVTVGSGGPGGQYGFNPSVGAMQISLGASGAPGAVVVTWTAAAAPTCTLTADTNPLSSGDATTLRWTSANATTFSITSVGSVAPNVSGSTSVSPGTTTTYTGSVVGSGTGSCSITLTVNSPSNCTFNGSTVLHGSSVTAYAASTVPYNQSCQSQSRTCTHGTLSGTYQYPTCTQDDPPASCSLSVSPTSIAAGDTALVTWSSTDATSCTGTNMNTGGLTSGSITVSPSATMTYSVSCTGPGGMGMCSRTLPVTCADSYVCSGQSVMHSDAACNQTLVETCVSPAYCLTGNATCMHGSISGTLVANPTLVRPPGTSTVVWTTTNANTCSLVYRTNVVATGTSGTYAVTGMTQNRLYVLVCDDGDSDTVEDDLVKSVFIRIRPTWREF